MSDQETGADPAAERTAEPGPESGLYQVQPHRCPAWSGQLEELACPECGGAIDEYESRPGYDFPVYDPQTGEVKRLVGTADEVFADHQVPVGGDHKILRVIAADQLVVRPCGHVLTGCDAHRALTAINKIRAVRRRAAAEATIAEHRQLLDAVESAGHGPVVVAYRRAVHAGSRHAEGLLAALRLLDPDESAGLSHTQAAAS